MSLYGIRLSNGVIIRDPEWVSVAAVMAGEHGQGRTRVGGELVLLCRKCGRPLDEHPE